MLHSQIYLGRVCDVKFSLEKRFMHMMHMMDQAVPLDPLRLTRPKVQIRSRFPSSVW